MAKVVLDNVTQNTRHHTIEIHIYLLTYDFFLWCFVCLLYTNKGVNNNLINKYICVYRTYLWGRGSLN